MNNKRIALDIPIACTLTEPIFREREQHALTFVAQTCEQVVPLDDGYRLRFSANHADKLLNFVQMERECCEFFKFELHFEPQHGPLWFHIRGPAGTKAFLTPWFAG